MSNDKRNLYDKAILRANEVIDKVSAGIASEFKGTMPTDKPQMTLYDAAFLYSGLTPLEKKGMIQHFDQQFGEGFTVAQFAKLERAVRQMRDSNG